MSNNNNSSYAIPSALARAMPNANPEPNSLAEFLHTPRKFRPKPEYLTTAMIDDDTVLTHCIKTQNAAAVEVLLVAGADANQPSRKGIAPISAAAHKGNTVIMQMLVNFGASVNSMNTTGSTALIQAAHFGHLEAVEMLLAHNALADFANQKGTTALMRSSQEGHVEISKRLINSSVDVNRKNHEGMNALMLASQRGHADIVHVLVKAGAAMDEQTSQGSTALMLACKRGHERCAEVLVSMGAEIYMRDRRFRTARDTATRRNHYGLLRWLDTQVQVRRVQEARGQQRAAYLEELRQAFLKDAACLPSALEGVSALYMAFKRMRIRALIGSSSSGGAGGVEVGGIGCVDQADGHNQSNLQTRNQLQIERSMSICLPDFVASSPTPSTAAAAAAAGVVSAGDSMPNTTTNTPTSLVAATTAAAAAASFSPGSQGSSSTSVTAMATSVEGMHLSLAESAPADAQLLQEFLNEGASRAGELRVCSLSSVATTVDPLPAAAVVAAADDDLDVTMTTGFAPSNNNNSNFSKPVAKMGSQLTMSQFARAAELEEQYNTLVLSQPELPHSSRMLLRTQGYSDWQWPFLMMRCMTLPAGLTELIWEFLPLPRVWQWSLLRLKRRCKLAPQQAVQDLSKLMDEIVCDLAIFPGSNQTNLLMKINQSPQIHTFLLEKMEMPAGLLDSLCEFADVQGLLLRNSQDTEVSFKSQYARKMLGAAVELYRWFRHRNNALKVLQLTSVSNHSSYVHVRRLGDHSQKPRRFGSGGNNSGVDSCNQMEGTDIAGEEASDYEADFVILDQDTESEMVVEEDGAEVNEDSDSDNDNVPLHNVMGNNGNLPANMVAMHLPPPPPAPVMQQQQAFQQQHQQQQQSMNNIAAQHHLHHHHHH